jgi:predicted site-specific integrase-resolvase
MEHEEEIGEELSSSWTRPAGKLHGMRSHRKKSLVEGFKKLLEEVEKSG